MKTRLKNYFTTAIGILLMLMSVIMFFLPKFVSIKSFSLLELIMGLVLGWVFLMAKNTLIEGIFLGIFKMKK